MAISMNSVCLECIVNKHMPNARNPWHAITGNPARIWIPPFLRFMPSGS